MVSVVEAYKWCQYINCVKEAYKLQGRSRFLTCEFISSFAVGGMHVQYTNDTYAKSMTEQDGQSDSKRS